MVLECEGLSVKIYKDIIPMERRIQIVASMLVDVLLTKHEVEYIPLTFGSIKENNVVKELNPIPKSINGVVNSLKYLLKDFNPTTITINTENPRNGAYSNWEPLETSENFKNISYELIFGMQKIYTFKHRLTQEVKTLLVNDGEMLQLEIEDNNWFYCFNNLKRICLSFNEIK